MMNARTLWNSTLSVCFILMAWTGPAIAATSSGGRLVAWGENSVNQCDVPSGTDFVSVSAGDHHSFAFREDGSLVAWGWNEYGQCDIPEGYTFVQVDGGERHSIGLTDDGAVVTWGGEYPYSNVKAVPEGNDFVAVAAGYRFSLALRSDGTIEGWGAWWHDAGRSYSNYVPDDDGFIAISACGWNAIALKDDGSAVGWEASNIASMARWEPWPEGNDLTSVWATGNHGLARRQNGEVIQLWRNGSFNEEPTLSDSIIMAAGVGLPGYNYWCAVGIDASGDLLIAGDDPVFNDAPNLSSVTAVAAGASRGVAIVTLTPGDCDGDGDVDLDDFVILKQNFLTGTTWGEGDFDLDGDVDLDDFVILKQNFLTSAVP